MRLLRMHFDFPAPYAMTERIRGRRGVELRRRRLQAEPLCRMCRQNGRVTPATVPDHIKPISQGGTNEPDNIQCLCLECHNLKTRKDMGYRLRQAIGVDGWPIE